MTRYYRIQYQNLNQPSTHTTIVKAVSAFQAEQKLLERYRA